MTQYKTNKKTSVYAVLLAGGTGTRLWPVSRELYPKQLVKFIGADSLVQSTIKRLTPVLDTENIRIVCGEEHFHETARHMAEIGVQAKGKIICEPCGRNTAPAILLAILNILKIDSDAVLCVFPADHVIRNVEKFHKKLNTAINLAKAGYIVTFGIKPHYPETGYGYIEGSKEIFNEALAIKRFVEKPDKATATRYIEAGNFYWNSGMFTFKASVMIEEFRKFQPELLEKMEELVLREDNIIRERYQQLPDVAFDYAIMEKTEKGVVLPSDFGWSDIGSWKSLYDFLPKDENNNVIDGDVIAKDTKNCFIMGHERLIATNHLDNMVVVETPDSVFVSDIVNSRDVKSIVAQLKEKGRKEYHEHKTVYHSWGILTVLEEKDDYMTAKLIVYPGSIFQINVDGSMFKHLIIIKGRAKIKSAGQTILLNKGETTVLSGNNPAELENPGNKPLFIIQVRY
ncbi:MAG: mannose-1-phosphate guanylyltransferase/mannose-6-phosphate isomerase [Deltaproteobacteria bacterium]|nr:mannose-1-phosphate guanylyltransferase/mannose-6-phosphate isomerase [Deltaproteobacteria bacterium]MBW2662510.1 mannose-1-phosphate guanylyltransferase/mannose-6-phosphate isomerase [Deltaproteobacteria bacterium]